MFQYSAHSWYGLSDIAPPGTEDAPPGTIDYPLNMMEELPPGAEDAPPPGIDLPPVAEIEPPAENPVSQQGGEQAATAEGGFQNDIYNHGFYPYAYQAPPPPPEVKVPAKPTVLGKLQAKKRLLAFSQTKQLKPPGVKSPPKAPSKLMESVFKNANSADDDEKEMKKKKKESKIPTAFRNMAEIKKEEEAMKKTLLENQGKRLRYDRNRSSYRRSRSRSRSRSRDRHRTYKRSRSRDRDRRSKRSYSSYSSYTSHTSYTTRSDSRSDRRTTETSSYFSTSEAPTSDRESTISRVSRKTEKSDKESRNGDTSKSQSSASSERSQKSKGKENLEEPPPRDPTPPPKSPASWSQLKAEISSGDSKTKSEWKSVEWSSRSREKARSAASSRQSPTRTKSSLFSTPEHNNPFVALSKHNKIENNPQDRKEKEYPQHLIKFTKFKPNISFCINPTRTPGFYKSRTEILGSEPPVIVDIMNQFLESAVASVSDSFGLETLQNSYDMEDMSDDDSTETKKIHERPWMVEESRLDSLSEVKFIPASIEESKAEKAQEVAEAKMEETAEKVDEETSLKKAKKRKLEAADDEKEGKKKKKKKIKKSAKRKKNKKKAKKKSKKADDSDDSSDDEEMDKDGAAKKKKKTKKKEKKKSKHDSSSDGSTADTESDAENAKKRTKKLKKKKSKKESSASDSEKEEEHPKIEAVPTEPSTNITELLEQPEIAANESKVSDTCDPAETSKSSVIMEPSLGSSFENFIRSTLADEAKSGKKSDGNQKWAEFEEYLRLKVQREKVLKELKEDGSKKKKKKKKKKKQKHPSDSSSTNSSSESDSKRKRKKKKSKKKRARSSSSSSSVSENSPRFKLELESDNFYLEGGGGQGLEKIKEELQKGQEELPAPQTHQQPDQVSKAPEAQSALYSPSQMSTTTSSESSDQESSFTSNTTATTSTPLKEKSFTDDDGWDIMPKNCISSSSPYMPVITPSMLLYQQSNQIAPIKLMPKIEFKTTSLKLQRPMHPEFADDDDEDEAEPVGNEAKADKTKDGKDDKKSRSPERSSRRRRSIERRRSSADKRTSPSRRPSPGVRRRGRRSPERLRAVDKRKQGTTWAKSRAQRRKERPRIRGHSPPRRPKTPPSQRHRSPERKRRSRSPPRRRPSPRHRSPPKNRPRSMGKPRTPSPRRSTVSPDKRAKIESDLLQEAITSPNSSPLVGLKRSVADSTISDSELQAAATKVDEPEYHNFIDKHYDEYYGQYQQPQQEEEEEEEEEEEGAREGGSPKRISLDDRIELELGVKKDAPMNQIPVFQFSQGNYNQFYGDQYYQQNYDYGQEKTEWRNQEPYAMPSSNPDARVLQIGNVLQVVPRDDLENKEPVAPPKSFLPKATPGQVIQVGNVLQVVPQPLATPVPSSAIPIPIILAHPPVPGLITDPAAVEAALEERRLTKERKKAKRQAEREERRKLRMASKLQEANKQLEDDKVKAAEEADAEELRLIQEAMSEIPRGEDDEEEEEPIEEAAPVEISIMKRKSRLPKDIPVKIIHNQGKPLRPISLLPAEKGILVSIGFRDLPSVDPVDPVEKTRKLVSFSDGVRPGEGTSPSGGEEMSSPPPPSQKMPKEKRFTKTAKTLPKKDEKPKKTKKKIKVKPVKDKVAIKAAKELQAKLEMTELENLPPPTPPQGSPPDYLKQYYLQCKTCIASGYMFNPTTRVFAAPPPKPAALPPPMPLQPSSSKFDVSPKSSTAVSQIMNAAKMVIRKSSSGNIRKSRDSRNLPPPCYVKVFNKKRDSLSMTPPGHPPASGSPRNRSRTPPSRRSPPSRKKRSRSDSRSPSPARRKRRSRLGRDDHR